MSCKPEWLLVETIRTFTVLHQVVADQVVATLYDAQMPGGVVRFAAFLQVSDGKIVSLRLLHDASEYRARGGR